MRLGWVLLLLHLFKKYFQSTKKKSGNPFLQIIVTKWNNYIIGILYVNEIIIIFCWNIMYSVQFSLSVVSDSLQPHESQHARPPCPSPAPRVYPNSSIESVMPSNHLTLCRPLLLLPSIFPSIRVFSNESILCIRCPKYWSFSFNISPSNEYPGLISFRLDWLDLLAVQGSLKSLLQHHSSKASVLQCSAFFTVWLSHPYITTG